MSELVQDTEGKLDEQPGHKWEIRTNNFGRIRCWARIPLRSSKAALEQLTRTDCRQGRLEDDETVLRVRVHHSHVVMRRGQWLECQKCRRISKEQDGRVQSWLTKGCTSKSGQMKLTFGPSSDS